MSRRYFVSIFLVLIVLVQIGRSDAAFIASKHRSAGIIVGSDGRGHSTAKGVLVDVNEAKDIYKLTDMTYLACIASPSEFECLLNEVRAFLVGMRPYTKLKGEVLSTGGIARVVHKMVRELYPKVHVIVLGYSSEAGQYQLFEILPSGTLIEQDLVCAGGGSDCILGLLEAQLWNRRGTEIGSGGVTSIRSNAVDNVSEMYRLIGVGDDDDDDENDNSEDDLLIRREKIVRHAVQIAMLSDHRSGGKEKILRFTKEGGLTRIV